MQNAFPKAFATTHDRRSFVGGSEARIVMGTDQAALLQLWREKRGEAEPEDLSGNLVVQLGRVTGGAQSALVRGQFGQEVTDVQKHLRHPSLPWMGATLDGRVRSSGAVFEAKFMLPWSFTEGAAVEKYAPQLQHNMWVVAAWAAVLSIITGGGKWVEIKVNADPLCQHLIVTAERKFWRCVESSDLPTLFGVDPPKPRVEAVRFSICHPRTLGQSSQRSFPGLAKRIATYPDPGFWINKPSSFLLLFCPR